MQKIFITGIQGSGKSTLAVKLTERGYPTLDTDDISRWVDADGIPLTVQRPSNPPMTWLRSHAWIMDQTKLHQYFNQAIDGRALLCGISWDQDQYYDIFDKIILLAADEPTIRKRLMQRDGTNEFGKMPSELQLILGERLPFQQKAINAGAIVVDTSQPLEIVTSEIIQAILQQ